MGPNDDGALVARMRECDAEALREIVRLYQERIFALIYGIVRDEHEVQDVAQEVFLKVFSRIDAFDGRSRFYTWLYRVAANAAKDHLKKRKRRPAIALEDQTVLPDREAGPQERAATEETRKMVRDAIDSLPDKYRVVLTLRELEGLAYNEIAAVLKVSLGTVESRLHRARERLKRRLATHAQ